MVQKKYIYNIMKTKKKTRKAIKQIGGVTVPSNFSRHIDLSTINLAEVNIIVENVKHDIEELSDSLKGKPYNLILSKKRDSLRIYMDFLGGLYRLKIIEELNEKYFGRKLSLRTNNTKLPEAEVVSNTNAAQNFNTKTVAKEVLSNS
jgi:hypothetical protein